MMPSLSTGRNSLLQMSLTIIKLMLIKWGDADWKYYKNYSVCVPSCKGPEHPMEIKSQNHSSQALPPAK